MEQKLRSRLGHLRGKLFWIIPPRTHPRLRGCEAGYAHTQRHSGKRYWYVRFMGRKLKRSHIIFFLSRGWWPRPCVDHINGDSLDDRPDNLREATILQNAWNHKCRAKKSGLPMGVRKSGDRYQARIGFCGKQIHLGSYSTEKAARAAYSAKREELFGEFA